MTSTGGWLVWVVDASTLMGVLDILFVSVACPRAPHPPTLGGPDGPGWDGWWSGVGQALGLLVPVG